MSECPVICILAPPSSNQLYDLSKSLLLLGVGILRMKLRSLSYWALRVLPAWPMVFYRRVYWFQILPPQTDTGTSSDMIGVEVRINIPKETNSPDSYVVRTFVLEK